MNRYLNIISLLLVVIGGLNWAFVGLFEFNLVSFLFGDMPTIEKAIYTLVGLAALYSISFFKMICPKVITTTPVQDIQK